jgi:hypothetical protein
LLGKVVEAPMAQSSPLIEHLMNLERRFWTSGPDFFGDHLGDPCLLAFEGLAGVLSRAQVLRTIGSQARWNAPQLELKGFMEPTDRVALMTYEARAARPYGEPYHALVSSGYLWDGENWKLIFHQQTPIQEHLPSA